MDSGTEDEAADRALSGVARKLDKSFSVEYTVNELIAEATDIKNLAVMFAGRFSLVDQMIVLSSHSRLESTLLMTGQGWYLFRVTYDHSGPCVMFQYVLHLRLYSSN